MTVVKFKPEWRLCHAAAYRCTQCGRQVEDEQVWRYFETSASYVQNVCQTCALTLARVRGLDTSQRCL